MIGRAMIKLAIITTVLTVLSVSAIVVGVVLSTEQADNCRRAAPQDISFTQVDNVLQIEWEPGCCMETYTLSIRVDGTLMVYTMLVDETVYFFNYPDMACTTIEVKIAVAPTEDEFIKKSYTPEIGGVAGLAVEDWKVMWSSMHMLHCAFQVTINDGPVISLDVGSNFYELEKNLPPCQENTVTITPVSPEGKEGTSTDKVFNIIPWVDWGFTIEEVATFEQLQLKATWVDNDPECTYNVYYKNEVEENVCSDIKGDQCEIEFSEDAKACQVYEYELRVTASTDEYSAASDFYSPAVEGKDDFEVEYTELKTIAKWNYLGPGCKHLLMLGSSDSIVTVDGTATDGLYTHEISNEDLDLCTTTTISLITTSVSGEEIMKSPYEYTPIPDIENVDLEADFKILASWTPLGDSCSYNVKYEEESKEGIREASVYIDEVFGKPTNYCAEHKVSVSATTADNKTGKSAENTVTKALIADFEGVSKTVNVVGLFGSMINIKWDLLDALSQCDDIHYRISWSLDGKEPGATSDVDKTSYNTDTGVTDSYLHSLHIFIQPLQKTASEETVGSTTKCDFDVVFGESTTVIMKTCEYIPSGETDLPDNNNVKL